MAEDRPEYSDHPTSVWPMVWVTRRMRRVPVGVRYAIAVLVTVAVAVELARRSIGTLLGMAAVLVAIVVLYRRRRSGD